MKKFNLILTAVVISGLLISSCTKETLPIDGTGPVITKTLEIDDFTKIEVEGVDNVIITYGEEQNVTVSGHSNIIDRIETGVSDEKWNIRLENGNYGNYELTYYLTLPILKSVENIGTGDVIIDEFIHQETMDITLKGTGNYMGFAMELGICNISVTGTGICEVHVVDQLNVIISGTGEVHYKGYPEIIKNISGFGKVIDRN